MNTEQQLIEKWRNLPSDKQQQVLQFVESLNEQKQPKQTELGQRLRPLMLLPTGLTIQSK